MIKTLNFFFFLIGLSLLFANCKKNSDIPKTVKENTISKVSFTTSTNFVSNPNEFPSEIDVIELYPDRLLHLLEHYEYEELTSIDTLKKINQDNRDLFELVGEIYKDFPNEIEQFGDSNLTDDSVLNVNVLDDDNVSHLWLIGTLTEIVDPRIKSLKSFYESQQ